MRKRIAHGPDLTVPASGLGRTGAGKARSAPAGERRGDGALYCRRCWPTSGRQAANDRPIDRTAYVPITVHGTLGELDRRGARGPGVRVRHTRPPRVDPMPRPNSCGFSLATAPAARPNVPLAHKSATAICSAAGSSRARIPAEEGAFGAEAAAGRQERAEGRPQPKIRSRHHAAAGASTIAPYDDTLLISYVTDAGTGGQSMDALSERWLGHTPIAFKDVWRVRPIGDHPSTWWISKRATAYAAEGNADVTLRLGGAETAA